MTRKEIIDNLFKNSGLNIKEVNNGAFMTDIFCEDTNAYTRYNKYILNENEHIINFIKTYDILNNFINDQKELLTDINTFKTTFNVI